MRIAIDCRLVFQTGVGRYIRAILKELVSEAEKKDHEYFLIIQKEDEKKFKLLPKNIKTIISSAKWHTFKEQIEIPHLLYKHKIDLVHFPYFNVPVFISTKFLVTIHDLTINKFNTGKATSLPIWLYLLKKLSYFIVLRFAVWRAVKILTVSETIKQEIIKIYGTNPEKIQVIYNGSELENGGGEEKNIKEAGNEYGDYILYVGNLHPHKNIETLVLAFDALVKEEKFQNFKLVIVSPFDFFYKKLFGFISKLKLENKIEFTGPVDNFRLGVLYKNAQVFVFPSFSEGFGIPGVEAMAKGCPVVASDLPIFREIYADAALYFNPKNAVDLKEKIALAVLNTNLRSKMFIAGLEQAKKYSWENSAKEILKTYEDSISLRPRE